IRCGHRVAVDDLAGLKKPDLAEIAADVAHHADHVAAGGAAADELSLFGIDRETIVAVAPRARADPFARGALELRRHGCPLRDVEDVGVAGAVDPGCLIRGEVHGSPNRSGSRT